MTRPRGWINPNTPPASPWRFYADGSDDGLWMWAEVTFGADNVLTGGTVFRGPTCPYTKVVIGSLNQDGSPKAGAHTVTVPAGTNTFTKAQLNAVGLTTVNDIAAAPQITASR